LAAEQPLKHLTSRLIAALWVLERAAVVEVTADPRRDTAARARLTALRATLVSGAGARVIEATALLALPRLITIVTLKAV
jgi:hypothetical protein